MTDAGVHELSREDARRIAVRAQLLEARRPTDLVCMVEQLTLLQIDPTAAIAPTADLVAWSRLGESYRPEHLRRAVEDERALFEFDATLRPMRHLGLFLAAASERPAHARGRAWLEANEQFRLDILARLEHSGPLTSRDIPDTSVVPWPSSGWTNSRNVTQMLEYLVVRGEVAIPGRTGRERLFDLAERVYPRDVEIPTVEEATRRRNELRLRSLGIARAKTRVTPIERVDVGEAGEPAVVEGVKGAWRIDPGALGSDFSPRTALLSPFDRLIHDRVRALQLFDFDYALEMYKPLASRRWGYYSLPILHGDRLVGKLDATADRGASALRVNAIHEDVPFDAAVLRAVSAEIEALGAWLRLERIDGL